MIEEIENALNKKHFLKRSKRPTEKSTTRYAELKALYPWQVLIYRKSQVTPAPTGYVA